MDPISEKQRSTESSPSHSNSKSLSEKAPNSVPERVLIWDRFSGEWVVPTQVHYIFEDEEVPDSIPKEKSILVDLDEEAKEVINLQSFSPYFLAYDAVVVPPGTSYNQEASLIPEQASSPSLSTIVLNGAYSRCAENEENNLARTSNLVSNYKEGKMNLSDAIEGLEVSFTYRNQVLQSILDLESEASHQPYVEAILNKDSSL